MKSLFLTNEYPPYIYGGAGVHVEYLTRELAKLMDVEVRCFGDQEDSTGTIEVHGTGLDNSKWTSPANLKSVFGALQRNLDFNTSNIDAQVVHLHTWYAHFGGILAKLNYGIPMVLTVHSLEPLRPWKREQLGGGYDFTCWLEKTAIEMADAIVAVSEETKVDVMRLFKVDPHKIHVIHNGIDTRRFADIWSDGEKQALRKSLGLPETGYVVGLCAVMRPEKAHGDLLAALARLRDEGLQVCGLLIGDGPLRASIQAQIDALGLGDQVRITGLLDDVRPAIACCDLMALTSHAVETFSIAALEAMTLGKPMVMSDIGGAAELVIPGDNGLLYPAGDVDALTHCLREFADPALRQAAGRRAAALMRERFDIDPMVRGYERVFTRFAARPASASYSTVGLTD